MADSWRIVIASQREPDVAELAAICRDAAHTPVAHMFARGFRQETIVPPPFDEFLQKLVLAGPPDVDLLVPARKASIAPLLRSVEPDLLICSTFPWLVPDDALAVPRLGSINVHPSLLPKYRGPLPINAAVRHGETEIGLTVHRMDSTFDTGNLLAQAAVPLLEDDDMKALDTRLRAELRPLILRAFERIAAADPGDAQDEAYASYAPMVEPEVAFVDWRRPACEIHNQVRMWRLPVPFEGA